MTEPKHTLARCDDRRRICPGCRSYDGEHRDDRQFKCYLDDAALIAAAPDLLAACEIAERYISQTLMKTIVNSWDYEAKRHFRECESLHLALVDAIKKAKGTP